MAATAVKVFNLGPYGTRKKVIFLKTRNFIEFIMYMNSH
jgi:hypothetical protein